MNVAVLGIVLVSVLLGLSGGVHALGASVAVGIGPALLRAKTQSLEACIIFYMVSNVLIAIGTLVLLSVPTN